MPVKPGNFCARLPPCVPVCRPAVQRAADRFGQGSFPLRIIKLLLYKLKLWKAFDFVRTRGNGYQVSEGDGVFYSYSAFDILHQIQQWAESVYLFPPDKTGIPVWFHPLLTSGSVLLIAIRKQQAPEA